MEKDANVVMKLTCLASNIKCRGFAFFSLIKYGKTP
jgi:hypothetical protein